MQTKKIEGLNFDFIVKKTNPTARFNKLNKDCFFEKEDPLSFKYVVFPILPAMIWQDWHEQLETYGN